MRKQLKWRLVVICLVVAAALAVVWPPDERVRLGLDLKGGVHLVLRVRTDEGLRFEAEGEARRLREEAELVGIELASIAATLPTEVQVSGISVAREPEVRELATVWLDDYERIEATADRHRYRLLPDVERARRDETVEQALLTVGRRVEAFGVTEQVITRHGAGRDQILVQLPGVDDVDGAKEVIRSTGVLELTLVERGPARTRDELLAASQGAVPRDRRVVVGPDPVPGTTGRGS